MQKDYFTIGLADSHIVVGNTRQQISQLRQFMIMRREQGFRTQPGMVMQIFHYRPGNRNAIIGAGAAPDFIEHQQAARGSMMQDVGGLDHLYHKSRLPGMNLILRADAGKNAIH